MSKGQELQKKGNNTPPKTAKQKKQAKREKKEKKDNKENPDVFSL